MTTLRDISESARALGFRAACIKVSAFLMLRADAMDASEGDATEEGNALRRAAIDVLAMEPEE